MRGNKEGFRFNNFTTTIIVDVSCVTQVCNRRGAMMHPIPSASIRFAPLPRPLPKKILSWKGYNLNPLSLSANSECNWYQSVLMCKVSLLNFRMKLHPIHIQGVCGVGTKGWYYVGQSCL